MSENTKKSTMEILAEDAKISGEIKIIPPKAATDTEVKETPNGSNPPK